MKNEITAEAVINRAPMFFALAKRCPGLESLRERLSELSLQLEFDTFHDYDKFDEGSIIRVRDCARAFRGILRKRSDDLAGFSVARAIRDVARGKPRADLSPAFWADLAHILTGVQGTGKGKSPGDAFLEESELRGRDAAIERSRELDRLWSQKVEPAIKRFHHGLSPETMERRKKRRARILKALGGSESDWNDYRWQFRNIARTADQVAALVTLSDEERENIERAIEHKLPFGVTPHYLALMDDEPGMRDRAVRAQVFPPRSYLDGMAAARSQGDCSLDFMLEGDTSPIDLITRRYPAIAIFKPFNTCPQICVYCQRNWEIDEPMEKGALAPAEKIEAALKWVAEHPAIHELLITGGDPLAMSDDRLEKILRQVARIPSIENVRIGSRIPVTAPMRIGDRLADILAGLRIPGRRQAALVTHVQHPYEITPETVEAVTRLRSRGIPVYNQLVYTYYVSRRFEAAALRRLLRLSGIDPYYTFSTKGKQETAEYRVPLARLLQEQKEEARLLPGLSRTDEAVFNVPGLGKNYLRAFQHRDLISIKPDGSRVYEFHPWEKNITTGINTYVGEDIPILEYLDRLAAEGERPEDYETIWYYY